MVRVLSCAAICCAVSSRPPFLRPRDTPTSTEKSPANRWFADSLLEEDGLEPSVPVDEPWFLSRKMLNLSKCLSARYPTVRRSGDVSLRAFRKRGARLGSSVSLWVTPHAWCQAARDQPWIEYGFYCDPVQSDPQRLLLICSAHFTSPHGRTS